MDILMDSLIKLHSQDSVAVTLLDLFPGMHVSLGSLSFPIHEQVPCGHKIALQNIPKGESIIRYGWPIGIALADIQAGDWIHTHNLGITDYERVFAIAPSVQTSDNLHDDNTLFFQGYQRSDGRAGTRNYVAVVAAVNCVNPVVRAIQKVLSQDHLHQYPNVDGILAITHDSGCSLPTEGLDHENLRRVLINIASHPNLAACLFVGLGCEVNQMAEFLAPLDIPYLSVQQEGGSQAAIRKAIEIVEKQMLHANTCQRSPQPASRLCLALQCGGSDAFSGITGNPLLGEISNRIAAQNGSVVIAETTEIFGAEQLLLQRVIEPEVGQKLRGILQWWQDYTKQMDVTVDNNPSPGNKAGGLTTIFEKSLGAISKCGNTPLREVLEYGEMVQSSGVCFMDSPGNDAVSLTGQVAGGCNLVLFTTGRGTTYAPGLAPCLKVATTSSLFQHMSEDMDINAGSLLEGQTMQESADVLINEILAVASGKATKSESLSVDQVELVPWRRGAIL